MITVSGSVSAGAVTLIIYNPSSPICCQMMLHINCYPEPSV